MFINLWRKSLKIGGWLILLFFFAVVLRIAFKATSASAANLYFYPQFCAGGWENPHNGAGEPQNFSSKNFSDFNTGNSAYLEPNVAAQIFCGFFPVETREELPDKVSLRFHWMMDFNGSFIPSTVKDETVTEKTESPIDKTEDLNEISEDAELPTPSVPIEEVDIEVEEEPENIEETPNISEPSPEPIIESSWLRKLIPVAYAQGLGSPEDFLSVSYSLDGVRWIMVGKTNYNNWHDFSVDIPISSWEDLQKIQVMLNVLPTVGTKPGIYIDAIGLEIEYDRPIGEAVSETVEDTGALVLDALDTTAEAIVAFFTEETVVTEEVKPEPVVVKEKKLIFSQGGEKINTTRSLPWYSNDFREKVSILGGNENLPNIQISEEGRSAKVSGRCEDSYFVVLLWKNSEDYIERPGSFASNFADHCVDGKYEYDLNQISKEIADGQYYLLVSSEDETNPWVPATALMPISISSVIEERVIESNNE
mgnify:CR=1 FL=1